MRSSKSIIYKLVLIAGVIVLANFVSNLLFVRLDFTADKAYTLSKSTKNILKNLKEPVTVTAYFSKDVPPELIKGRRDFKDLLVEYSNLSKNKIKFEFIDPSGKEEIEQKAMQAGIQPVLLSSNQKDQVKQQKAFIGAVVHMGEKSESIPVIQPGAAMEYALSTAIRKMSDIEKPLIGVLQGQGQPSLGALQQVYSELSVMYQVDPVFLNDTSYILNRYKTIAIVAPRDSVKESYLQQLDRFLSEGGNLLIALNRVDGQMAQSMGVAVNTGFEKWLEKKGIIVDENFVADALCGVVGVQEQVMGFMLTRQLEFHYFPILKTFAKHPVTEGLEAVIMSFASTVGYKGDNTKQYQPLLMTSEQSVAQPAPLQFDMNKEWQDSDFPSKNLVVAAAITGKFGGTKPGKVVVIGDGDFAVNGEGQQAHEINPDNANFFVNAIDWLSDDTGLIQLRTKGVTMRPLDQISDSSRLLVKILNFALPILLIIGYGIWRMNNNRRIRLKRMEEGYV
ncbi:MAG TPA: Gldg family protein [Bacteroidales bacterium]|nr:Gldg family protein [Bacteroidales bacterium]